ncbi:MAG TPA: serine hydrolase [Steroidobacteraceae bacterium]|nr:serine hydrolase [Steroidobacteraceae bacterium]
MAATDPPARAARLPTAASTGAAPSVARRLYAGALAPDGLVDTLKHTDRLFPVATVRRGPGVRGLPDGPRRLGPIRLRQAASTYDLVDYLALNRVAGLLVLKDGAIALEDYELGLAPADRWASFSIAKSVCSTLVGAAIADGFVSGVEEPLTRHLPELAGTAYDGVSIRQLLQMASGVGWDETYTDPESDRRRFLELQIAGRPGSLIGFMGSLPRAAPPGLLFNYSTGETFLVGALLEAATHQPLASYLSAKIWEPAGMESDATWWLESPSGAGIGGSGLAATLRDYGRFAQFVLEDGIVGGTRIVPAGWFLESTAARMQGGVRVDYGYQWWPLPPADPVHRGAFAAQGIFGQRIYLNPGERLVIIVLSARPKPTGAHVVEDAAFFAAVAAALA